MEFAPSWLIQEDIVLKDVTGQAEKTVLLALNDDTETDFLKGMLARDGYRVFKAGNFLSLINKFERFNIHVLISDVDLPGFSMIAFLPFLRERYEEVKVIIIMKEYSPEVERALRPYKVMYVMPHPVNGDLLKSVLSYGLKGA